MDGTTAAPTAASGGIVKAMLAVMAEVGVIGKDRKAPGLGYQFRGIDDILPVLQPLFVKHGVLVTPEVVKDERESVTTKGGAAMVSVRLLVRHTFRAVDGSCVVATTLGEAMDNGDKASNKAMTAAFKAALTESFSIPTKESDRDTEEHSPELERPKTSPVTQSRPVAATREDAMRVALQAPDRTPGDVEKEKGLLRAFFETSVTVAELDAHWPRVKKLPNADIAELTPVFTARKKILVAQAQAAKP